MPNHALLGATGSTGSAVLRFLLDEPIPDLKLTIFVRNRAKLLRAFPDLDKTTDFKISIIEANTDDTAALRQCLDRVDVIYNCISTNDSSPGVHTSRDIAKTTIEALEANRNQNKTSYQPPLIIINRSATLNPELRKTAPMITPFVHFALGEIYYDIDEACKLFKQASDDNHLLDYIYADPPALHESPNTGRTGYNLILTGPQSPGLSYADLGASFVELGQRKDEYKGKGVAISATGKVDEDIPQLMSFVLRGLRARLLRF